MGESIPLPPTGFEALTPEQQIDYVQSLWDRIAEGQRKIPSPDWHRDVVRDRVAQHQADADPGRLWSELSADIRKKLKP